MCGAPSHILPFLQMQAAFTTSFISSSGGALSGGSSLEGERLLQLIRGGGGQNYFLRRLALNWRDAVYRTCSWSEINHLYVPNGLMLYCLVLYFFANPVTVF